MNDTPCKSRIAKLPGTALMLLAIGVLAACSTPAPAQSRASGAGQATTELGPGAGPTYAREGRRFRPLFAPLGDDADRPEHLFRLRGEHVCSCGGTRLGREPLDQRRRGGR